MEQITRECKAQLRPKHLHSGLNKIRSSAVNNGQLLIALMKQLSGPTPIIDSRALEHAVCYIKCFVNPQKVDSITLKLANGTTISTSLKGTVAIYLQYMTLALKIMHNDTSLRLGIVFCSLVAEQSVASMISNQGCRLMDIIDQNEMLEVFAMDPKDDLLKARIQVPRQMFGMTENFIKSNSWLKSYGCRRAIASNDGSRGVWGYKNMIK